MTRTHIGVVLGASAVGPETSVRIRLASGAEITFRCGTRVAIEAITLIGRTVRFTAELSESTVCLTQPLFVLGSGYGLKAVGAGGGATA